LLTLGRLVQKGENMNLAGLGELDRLIPVLNLDIGEGDAQPFRDKLHQVSCNTGKVTLAIHLLIGKPVRIRAYGNWPKLLKIFFLFRGELQTVGSTGIITLHGFNGRSVRSCRNC